MYTAVVPVTVPPKASVVPSVGAICNSEAFNSLAALFKSDTLTAACLVKLSLAAVSKRCKYVGLVITAPVVSFAS